MKIKTYEDKTLVKTSFIDENQNTESFINPVAKYLLIAPIRIRLAVDKVEL